VLIMRLLDHLEKRPWSCGEVHAVFRDALEQMRECQ
jgi:hypothetical protein